MSEKLQVGVKLQVKNEVERKDYQTTVTARGEQTFTIEEPLNEGRALNMPPQSSWQFCLLGSDAVYFFTARVAGMKQEDGGVSYRIEWPDRVQRQQRRRHVRVRCHHTILYWLWEEVEQSPEGTPHQAEKNPDLWEDAQWLREYLARLNEEVPPRNAFTLDLSGGGMRLVSLDKLDRGQRLLLKLVLDEGSDFQLLLIEAMVVRVMPLEIGGWKRYRIGVEFVNLDEKVQERLIAYIFRLMRRKV